jgi:hypothetical protein
MILASVLDMAGVAMGLWTYYCKVFPTVIAYAKFDITLIPVTAMLFYQYKPYVNPLIKAIIYAGISSFVIEPVFIWLRFYNPIRWETYYSFPIVVVIYLIGHCFIKADKFEKLYEVT